MHRVISKNYFEFYEFKMKQVEALIFIAKNIFDILIN